MPSDQVVVRDDSDLAPIAVLSFNRPAMLKTVLQSLMAQQDADIERRQICLLQDGAVNRYSRIRYAQDDDIRGCIAVFREVCPQGTVLASDDNIGVCENMLRAEEHMFEALGAPCAYFFEDDLLLSPAYVRMLDRLSWYSRGARIVAYFAAYGDYYADAASIKARRDECMTLDHNWGFGLFRHHWARIRAHIQPYYDIVLGDDYARRDHPRIYDHYEALGASPRGTSQDAAKAFACAQLGLWRCRTVLPFGRYIGDVGAHMSREQYEELGFARTVMADAPLERIRFPQEDEIREFVGEEARIYAEIVRDELPALREKLVRELDPLRLCTREEVIAAYSLILHRPPEGEAVLARHVGRRKVFELVESLFASDEYRLLASRVAQ